MKKFYTLLSIAALSAFTVTASPVLKHHSEIKPVNKVEIKEISAPVKAPAKEAAEITDWKSLGMGSMTDDMVAPWYQYEPVTYAVEILQSESAPTQYRVKAPYGQAFADAMKTKNNVTLTDAQYDKAGEKFIEIDASNPDDVIFHKTMIGCNWGDGEMYIGITTTGTVKLADGVFTASLNGLAVGDDTGAVTANRSGKFRIVLPGAKAADYSVEITPASQCLYDFNFSATVKLGADVSNVKWYVFPDIQEDEMMSMVKQIAAEGPAYPMVEKLEYEMDRFVKKETLVIVSLDAAGEVAAYDWVTYYNMTDRGETWKSIGMGKFTDEIAPGLLSMPVSTTDVEIEECEGHPGYYRLVNPYGEAYAYSKPGQFHADHKHYIYLNAIDPARIYIEESPIGVDWGYGMARVSSYAQYFLDAGFDVEEVDELEMYGVYEDGAFTFVETSLLFSMLGYDNGDWYESNENGETKIELPAGYNYSAAVNDVVVAPAETEAVYYNLQGMRVDRPDKGIFIRCTGGKSEKVRF